MLERLVFEAELKCLCGFKHSFSDCIDSIDIDNLPIARVRDSKAVVNIMPFGTCTLGLECEQMIELEDLWENPKHQNMMIGEDEAKVVKMDAIKNGDTFFAEIDGDKIKTEEDYVQAMANAFAFPHALPELKIGWYNDYISDLMWIEQKDIIMIIHNYDLMLVNDLKTKKNIIAGFEEIILPWWEGEVVGHMVGEVPRKFLIYLEGLCI